MLKEFISSGRIRLLAGFGIALPCAILLACNALRRRFGDLDVFQWTTIIAGFWWILGMLVTGIALIRDALRRDD